MSNQQKSRGGRFGSCVLQRSCNCRCYPLVHPLYRIRLCMSSIRRDPCLASWACCTSLKFRICHCLINPQAHCILGGIQQYNCTFGGVPRSLTQVRGLMDQGPREENPGPEKRALQD